MFLLHALEADEPLTKTLYLDESGVPTKSNYPPVYSITSHDFKITTLADFHRAVTDAAAKGWCLLKGKLKKPLIKQSRAGSTETDDTTHWMCLDIDGLTGFKAVSEFMDNHPDLKDVSYIVQYSSSSGLPNTKGIHAHVFMLLSHEYHATYLKGWLIKQNIDDSLFKAKIVEQLSLNRTQSVLRYPIDITACQNDKLLYVAPPNISKGVKYKLPDGGFIQLVKKQYNELPIERLHHGSLEQQKTNAKKRFNVLRKEAGLDPITAKPKIMDGFSVEPECGEFQITGQREERGFHYFNMNGGDSWSWYHPLGNYKYIHCFKDDRVYLTSRILPNYFKKCEIARRTPKASEDGLTLLAFRDIRSAAYFNGWWDANEQRLDLHQAKSELQLDHFLQQNGQPDGIVDFIPQWTVEFNPQSKIICDAKRQYLNTYVPSPYFAAQRSPSRDLSRCPTIRRVILSAVSADEWNEVAEHFFNWMAVIFQHRVKTRTAWVLHGVEGTGKGVLANQILTPLLGKRYVQQRRMSELEEKFTGWLEEALIAVVDEVQVSASQRKSLITGDLKNFITEPVCTIRHMNRMAYLAANYTNFLLFSNMDDPVQMSEHDRRFNSGDYQQHKLAFASPDKEAVKIELPHFMDYIMQREADIDRAAEIVKNKARSEFINASKNSSDTLADAVRDGNLTPLIELLPDTKLHIDIAGANSAIGVQYSNIVLRELNLLTSQIATEEDGFFHAPSRLSRDELFIIFEYAVGGLHQSPHRFTKMLKHKHIALQRIRIGDKPQMGVEVEWVASREWVDAYRVPTKVTSITEGKRRANNVG